MADDPMGRSKHPASEDGETQDHQIARLQALLRKAHTDLQVERTARSEDLRRIAEMEERVRDLEARAKSLAEANATAAELTALLEERNRSLEQANHQIAKANANAAEMVALVELKEDEVRALNRALALANAQAAELIADRETRMAEIQRLNARLMEEIEVRRRAEAQVKNLANRLKRANRELERLATLDPLTNVHNRRGLDRMLELELHRAERLGHGIGVLFADFDNFKSVNERFGHSGGDAALREAARRLRDSLRATDHLGRIGGDEFVALIPGVGYPELEIVANHFLKSLSRNSLRIGDQELWLTLSVAAGLLPPEVVDLDGILRWSRRTLQRCKEEGKNRVHFLHKD